MSKTDTAAKADPILKGFRVLRTLDHDGTRYAEGKLIDADDLTADEQAALLAGGVIEAI